jgi:serine/threonine protein kinase
MFLVKTGSSSIILGPGHFNNYFPNKQNKLLKITKISSKHNELKYLDKIRQIENHKDYYSIPEDLSFTIKPSTDFYNYIEHLVIKENLTIFNAPLTAFYIDNAGDRDLHDTLTDTVNYNDISVWRSYKSIINFVKQMVDALFYLHQHKLCHLDIKPENIMVNTYRKTFKLIDFGFSSVEPFDDYFPYIKGTPGYFPKYFPNDIDTEWLPRINANDLIKIDGLFPIDRDRKLVYKIDSYCFGRVLHYVKYIYEDNLLTNCCSFKISKKSRDKINNILYDLLDNNVFTRITITECKNKYFNK